MITDEQFKDYLAFTHETSGVEFKGPGSRKDNPLFGKVVRAAMGMANMRDGGFVIIGVSENGGRLSPSGLTNDQLSTWRYDDVASSFASYADPPINFDLDILESNGMKFIVLEIHEFSDIPVICKQEYKDEFDPNIPARDRKIVLRKGVFYIRSRHKPETVEAASAEEMRELLELAAEKRLRKFVALARSAPDLSYVIQPQDREQFKLQLSSSLGQLPEKISSRGYWQVIIRPSRFYDERIEYTRLYPLLQQIYVRHSGYDFPELDLTHEPTRDLYYISQNLDWALFPELWYFYQSGQFIDISAIDNDLMVRQETKILSVQDTVYRLTEIFEFASRLIESNEFASETTIFVEIQITGLEGRQLKLDFSNRSWMSSRVYMARFDIFPYAQEFARNELIANAKDLALQVAKKLFSRLGWEPAIQLLHDVQTTLG